MGLHFNYISDSFQPYNKGAKNHAPETLAYLDYLSKWTQDEGAYAGIQSTKPLSLAYGLNDSPIGLCAWIIEKFNAWSDNGGDLENCFTKDELLANVTLYWLTQTIYSSTRMYHGISQNPLVFGADDFVTTPVGFASFPKEIPTPPRPYVEQGLNVVRWTEMVKGGHFPALEQPTLLAGEVTAFFSDLLEV